LSIELRQDRKLNVAERFLLLLTGARLHPQSGWPQAAPSKGALDCKACENFSNTSSPSPSPSHQGRGKRVGRTYAGPPPEVEGLVTTKEAVRKSEEIRSVRPFDQAQTHAGQRARS
jgi:hypothetical protein